MRLTEELRFYAGPGAAHRIYQFPDWETLPYDIFRPTTISYPSVWRRCISCLISWTGSSLSR